MRLPAPAVILPLLLVMHAASDATADPAPPGHAFPYRGHLEHNGTPVDGERSLRFSFWTAQTGGTQIGTNIDRTLTVYRGTFATVLDPVPADLFGSTAVWLQIAVDGTVLAGRQQLLSVPFALGTVGGNDLRISGEVFFAGGRGRLTGDTSGNVMVLNDNDGVVIEPSGLVRTTGALQVPGTATAGALQATGAATVDGATQLKGATRVDGQLTLGALVDGCPRTMDRAGHWCIDKAMRTATTWTNAVSTCHSAGLGLCPLEAYVMCDQLNTNSNATVNSCGKATDSSVSRLLTSTTAEPYYTYATGSFSVVMHNGFETSVFDGLLCYDPEGSGNEPHNSLDGCNSNSSEAYFCCIPASAVGFAP